MTMRPPSGDDVSVPVTFLPVEVRNDPDGACEFGTRTTRVPRVGDTVRLAECHEGHFHLVVSVYWDYAGLTDLPQVDVALARVEGDWWEHVKQAAFATQQPGA